MLHNVNVGEGWANGTRARLLAHDSWKGKAETLTRNLDKSFAAAQVVHLKDETKHPDFNVKVVKHEESTLSKPVRYGAGDCMAIPVRTDRSSQGGQEWRQVQLALAYAFTGHKGQGMTFRVSYISLHSVFGFGLP